MDVGAARAHGHAIGDIALVPGASRIPIAQRDDPAEREAIEATVPISGRAPQAQSSTPEHEQTAARASASTLSPNVGIAGSGQSIDPVTRSSMESDLGHDFSRVRVHTGARADEGAQAIGARAFTVGSDIVFAEGQYAPAAPEGRRLLAHELTHVGQHQEAGASPVIHRAPTPGVADPGLIPIPRARPKPDEVERNWSREIQPATGPSKLDAIFLPVGSMPTGPKFFDFDTGTVDEGPEPLGTQRVTRELAWNTMRADVKRFEEGFNEMVKPHNVFNTAQDDESLKNLPFNFQRPGATSKLNLPEAAAQQSVAGSGGKTVEDAFDGTKLAKPGDAKELEGMKDSTAISAARGELRQSETELDAFVTDAHAAAKEIEAAAQGLKRETLAVQLEEKKDEAKEQTEQLEKLNKQKEKAAKFAESLVDITVSLGRAAAGDEKGVEKAAEGGVKLAVGAAADGIAGAIYGKQIDDATAALRTTTNEIKTLGKAKNDAAIEEQIKKLEAARERFKASTKHVQAAIDKRRNALTKLGVTIADDTTGAVNPEERKRIGGLIKALPIVELVASRAGELRLVAVKAASIQYTMASGIGFGMLTDHTPEVADKFIRNASILVGVALDADAHEKEWRERSKSVQAMIDQIGSGAGLPNAGK